jgi:hypothetical protein
MLAREVLRLRGTIYNRETPWDVMVDLYFCMFPLELTPATCTDNSQTATPRLRLRTRLRRRSSPALTRRAPLPSSPASRPPLVLTGRLPPLASLVPPVPLPPAGTVLPVRSGVLPLPTPSGLLPPKPPRSLSGRVLRPRRVMARDTKSLPLTGKTKIQKRGYQSKFKTEIEFETLLERFCDEREQKSVWMCVVVQSNYSTTLTFSFPPFDNTNLLADYLTNNIRGN